MQTVPRQVAILSATPGLSLQSPATSGCNNRQQGASESHPVATPVAVVALLVALAVAFRAATVVWRGSPAADNSALPDMADMVAAAVLRSFACLVAVLTCLSLPVLQEKGVSAVRLPHQ